MELFNMITAGWSIPTFLFVGVLSVTGGLNLLDRGRGGQMTRDGLLLTGFGGFCLVTTLALLGQWIWVRSVMLGTWGAAHSLELGIGALMLVAVGVLVWGVKGVADWWHERT